VLGTDIPIEILNVPQGLDITPRRFWTPATIHIRAADGRLQPFVVQAARLDKPETIELRGVAGQVAWRRRFYATPNAATDNSAPPVDFETLRRALPMFSDDGYLHHNWGNRAPVRGLPRDHFAIVSDSEIDLPAGYYEFFLRADYAAALRVNGTTLLNAPAPDYPGVMPVSTWLELPAGKQRLEVDYLHREGNADVRFELRRIDSIGRLRNVPAGVSRSTQDGALTIYLEGEDLRVVATSSPPPAISRPNMLPYGRYWSAGRQLRAEAVGADQWIDLGFSVPHAANYQLTGALTQSTDGGIIDLFLDDERLLAGVDLSGIRNETSPKRSWGQRMLSAGGHTLRIRVVGTNARSAGSRFAWGLDYLALVPELRQSALSESASDQ
jgi:hypothetical protein